MVLFQHQLHLREEGVRERRKQKELLGGHFTLYTTSPILSANHTVHSSNMAHRHSPSLFHAFHIPGENSSDVFSPIAEKTCIVASTVIFVAFSLPLKAKASKPFRLFLTYLTVFLSSTLWYHSVFFTSTLGSRKTARAKHFNSAPKTIYHQKS